MYLHCRLICRLLLEYPNILTKILKACNDILKGVNNYTISYSIKFKQRMGDMERGELVFEANQAHADVWRLHP